MKKIYCRKCGYKVFDSDTEYCPRCGTRLNDYSEVKRIEKNRKTKRILLIVLAIVIIVTAGILSYAMFFNEHYQVVQVSQSASLEMPVGKGLQGEYVNGTHCYMIKNGKGVTVTSYNSNNMDLASSVGFAAVKEIAVGSRFNENQVYQTTINGSTVWSIATGNDSTHDNIIISSHDKDLTLRIYNSIKYSNNSSDNHNTTASKNIVKSDNTKKADNVKTNEEIKKEEYTKLMEYNDAYSKGYEAGVSDSQYYYEPDSGGTPTPTPTTTC